MKYEDFISRFGNLPVIETSILLAEQEDPKALAVQISRWQKTGRLIQLRRGVYVLPEFTRKFELNEFYIACVLEKPSYVSLEKALEFYGLIPEAVPVFTCVTTSRPQRLRTPVGVFDYRHVRSSLFWGYRSFVMGRQTAFLACAEKALLDLFYLKQVKVTEAYLSELRLQNLEKINMKKLMVYAARFQKPKLLKAAGILSAYIRRYRREMRM